MTNIVSIPGFSEPISSISHLVSCLIFLIFGSKMIWEARGNKLRILSLIVYVFCSVFLFSMSGVYHLLQKGTTPNYVLQVLDHAGIYLMISGSFTPYQVILLRGFKRWTPLTVIWILSITGLTLTSIFFSDMPESLLLSFFIGMGWMSLFTVWFIKDIDFKTVKYIVIGGLLYTTGAIAEFLRWPTIIDGVISPHEIFHIFVSAAALVHLYGIYRISKYPISEILQVKVTECPGKLSAKVENENIYIFATSRANLKAQLRSVLNQKYLKKLIPSKIVYKYFEEEEERLSE